MAQKKIVDIEIKENLDSVNKKVDDVAGSLEDVKKKADQLGESLKKVEQDVKDIGSSSQKAESSLDKLGSSIRSIGSTIKGIGMGLLVTQFDDFKEALTGSNNVADLFSNSLNVVKKSASDLGNVATSGSFFDKIKSALQLSPGQALENVKKYFSAAYKQAEDTTKKTNDALFAQVKQQGIFEEYDRRAEEQRKIRDNELLPLSEREEANNKLLTIVQEQKDLMLAQAKIQLDAATAEYNLTGKREDKVKKMEAENNILAIQAQLQGFITEQDQARIALIMQRRQLAADTIKTEVENETSRLQTANSTIKTEGQRLQDERFNLKRSLQDWAKFYEDRIKENKKGSSGIIEIENEANLKLQEIRNAIAVNEDQTATYFYSRDQERRMMVVNNEREAFSYRLYALKKFNEEAQKSTQISEDEKRKIAADTLVQQKSLENQRLSMVSNTLGNISSLFEENSTAGKAFAISQALINTYQGITAELATKTATPFEFGLKVANIAATAAMGFKAVKDIIATPAMSDGASGISISGDTGSASAPQFNVVGASGVNQLAQSIQGRENKPVKAYVVASEVTSQQSLERNRVMSASIG